MKYINQGAFWDIYFKYTIIFQMNKLKIPHQRFDGQSRDDRGSQRKLPSNYPSFSMTKWNFQINL